MAAPVIVSHFALIRELQFSPGSTLINNIANCECLSQVCFSRYSKNKVFLV